MSSKAPFHYPAEQKALTESIRRKKSFLCVGLDVDLDKIPPHLLGEEDPIFAFNKAIIDATHTYAVAYKPNTAFYEAYGAAGWQSLEKTVRYIQSIDPTLFTIADAKRGDIGTTADRYAQAFFHSMDFDSVTVAPYMGRDSIEPFLAHPGKTTILLGLTSNPGSADFETIHIGKHPMYQEVMQKALTYAHSERLMFVVGATQTQHIAAIRQIVPDHFFLVPGVGAQGGSLSEVCRYGLNPAVGLLVNASRAIIYAGKGIDFAVAAQAAAQSLQAEMAEALEAYVKS
ncbi:MAG: orotidine-5'-phosphate decarboxylase [Flavobacteriaceae bacterium]